MDFQELWIETRDGVRLNAWFLPAVPADVKPVAHILFFHGNAGNLSHFLDKIAGLVRQGFSVLAVDYRGFGLSTGRPSVKGVSLDGRAAYDTLLARPDVTAQDIVIFGYSLGGGVAVDLAADVPARALILESTFTSIRDMARFTMPFIPGFLVSRSFESLAGINNTKMPLFVIHGDRDETVPVQMGRELYNAYAGPKDLFIVHGAGHTDTEIVGGETYYRRLIDFIQNTPV